MIARNKKRKVPAVKKSPKKPPAYLRIAEEIDRGIRDGRWNVDTALPPERELASSFGVSHMTLRHALDVLQQRGVVVREHGKGTFVRGEPGVGSRCRSIMLVGQYETAQRFISDPHYALIMRGIEDELTRRGVDLVISMKHDRSLRMIAGESAQIGGILLAAYNSRIRSETRELSRRNVPFVLMSKSPAERFAPCVDSDKEKAGRLAAEWLLQQGCRKLAFLIPGRYLYLRQRTKGCRNALAEAGMPYDRRLVSVFPDQKQGWREKIRGFFASRKPDGIILNLMPDTTRITLEEWQRYCERKGRSLPFVGFDDYEQVYRNSGLSGACVESPLEEIGRLSTEMLIDLAEGKDVKPLQRILPVRLVELRAKETRL